MALASRELELVLIARDRASSTIARVGGALTALGSAMTFAGVQGVKSLGGMAKEAADFRQQAVIAFTQVDNVANASIKSIEDSTKRIARTIPTTIEDIQGTFYDLFSTIDVSTMKEAEGIVREIAKAAVAGQAPMENIGRSTIAWMNALGEKATLDRTNQLLRIQFELVRKGAGTYEDFASSVGRGIPAYVNAEQSVESFSGALAFLTRNGLNAAAATTSTARSIELIFSKKGSEGLNKLGISLVDTEGNARSVVDILEDLVPHFRELDAEGRVKLFHETFGQGRIQARRFFNYVIPNFEEYKSLVQDMQYASEGALGFTKKALADMGIGSVEALRSAFDNLASLMEEGGFSAYSLGGAIAYSTQKGIELESSVATIEESLKNLNSLPNFGIALKDADGNSRKLVSVLRDVDSELKTIDSRDRINHLAKMLGTSEDTAKGFFNIFLDNLDAVETAIDDLQASSTDLEDAYILASEQPATQFQRLLNHLKLIRIEIGEGLFPIINAMLIPVLDEWLERWKKMSDEDKRMIAEMLLLGSVILIVVGSAIALVGTFTLLIGLLTVFPLQVAAAVFALGGFVLSLIQFGPEVIRNWEEIRRRTGEIWEGTAERFRDGNYDVQEQWTEMFQMLKTISGYETPQVLQNIIDRFEEWGNPVRDFWVDRWNESFDDVKDVIKDRVPGLFNDYETEINTFGPSIIGALGLIFGGPIGKILSSAILIAEFDKVREYLDDWWFGTEDQVINPFETIEGKEGFRDQIEEYLRGLEIDGIKVIDVPLRWTENFWDDWKDKWDTDIEPKISSLIDDFDTWWEEEGGKEFTNDKLEELRLKVKGLVDDILSFATNLLTVIAVVLGSVLGLEEDDLRELSTLEDIDWEKLVDTVLDPLNELLDFVEGVIETVAAALVFDREGAEEGMQKIDDALAKLGPRIVDGIFTVIELTVASFAAVLSGQTTGTWIQNTMRQVDYRTQKILARVFGFQEPSAPVFAGEGDPWQFGIEPPSSPHVPPSTTSLEDAYYALTSQPTSAEFVTPRGTEAPTSTPAPTPDPSFLEQALSKSIPIGVATAMGALLYKIGGKFGTPGRGVAAAGLGYGAGTALEMALGWEDSVLPEAGAGLGLSAAVLHSFRSRRTLRPRRPRRARRTKVSVFGSAAASDAAKAVGDIPAQEIDKFIIGLVDKELKEAIEAGLEVADRQKAAKLLAKEISKSKPLREAAKKAYKFAHKRTGKMSDPLVEQLARKLIRDVLPDTFTQVELAKFVEDADKAAKVARRRPSFSFDPSRFGGTMGRRYTHPAFDPDPFGVLQHIDPTRQLPPSYRSTLDDAAKIKYDSKLLDVKLGTFEAPELLRVQLETIRDVVESVPHDLEVLRRGTKDLQFGSDALRRVRLREAGLIVPLMKPVYQVPFQYEEAVNAIITTTVDDLETVRGYAEDGLAKFKEGTRRRMAMDAAGIQRWAKFDEVADMRLDVVVDELRYQNARMVELIDTTPVPRTGMTKVFDTVNKAYVTVSDFVGHQYAKVATNIGYKMSDLGLLDNTLAYRLTDLVSAGIEGVVTSSLATAFPTFKLGRHDIELSKEGLSKFLGIDERLIEFGTTQKMELFRGSKNLDSATEGWHWADNYDLAEQYAGVDYADEGRVSRYVLPKDLYTVEIEENTWAKLGEGFDQQFKEALSEYFDVVITMHDQHNYEYILSKKIREAVDFNPELYAGKFSSWVDELIFDPNIDLNETLVRILSGIDDFIDRDRILEFARLVVDNDIEGMIEAILTDADGWMYPDVKRLDPSTLKDYKYTRPKTPGQVSNRIIDATVSMRLWDVVDSIYEIISAEWENLRIYKTDINLSVAAADNLFDLFPEIDGLVEDFDNLHLRTADTLNILETKLHKATAGHWFKEGAVPIPKAPAELYYGKTAIPNIMYSPDEILTPSVLDEFSKFAMEILDRDYMYGSLDDSGRWLRYGGGLKEAIEDLRPDRVTTMDVPEYSRRVRVPFAELTDDLVEELFHYFDIISPIDTFEGSIIDDEILALAQKKMYQSIQGAAKSGYLPGGPMRAMARQESILTRGLTGKALYRMPQGLNRTPFVHVNSILEALGLSRTQIESFRQVPVDLPSPPTQRRTLLKKLGNVIQQVIADETGSLRIRRTPFTLDDAIQGVIDGMLAFDASVGNPPIARTLHYEEFETAAERLYRGSAVEGIEGRYWSNFDDTARNFFRGVMQEVDLPKGLRGVRMLDWLPHESKVALARYFDVVVSEYAGGIEYFFSEEINKSLERRIIAADVESWHKLGATVPDEAIRVGGIGNRPAFENARWAITEDVVELNNARRVTDNMIDAVFKWGDSLASGIKKFVAPVGRVAVRALQSPVAKVLMGPFGAVIDIAEIAAVGFDRYNEDLERLRGMESRGTWERITNIKNDLLSGHYIPRSGEEWLSPYRSLLFDAPAHILSFGKFHGIEDIPDEQALRWEYGDRSGTVKAHPLAPAGFQTGKVGKTRAKELAEYQALGEQYELLAQYAQEAQTGTSLPDWIKDSYMDQYIADYKQMHDLYSSIPVGPGWYALGSQTQEGTSVPSWIIDSANDVIASYKKMDREIYPISNNVQRDAITMFTLMSNYAINETEKVAEIVPGKWANLSDILKEGWFSMREEADKYFTGISGDTEHTLENMTTELKPPELRLPTAQDEGSLLHNLAKWMQFGIDAEDLEVPVKPAADASAAEWKQYRDRMKVFLDELELHEDRVGQLRIMLTIPTDEEIVEMHETINSNLGEIILKSSLGSPTNTQSIIDLLSALSVSFKTRLANMSEAEKLLFKTQLQADLDGKPGYILHWPTAPKTPEKTNLQKYMQGAQAIINEAPEQYTITFPTNVNPILPEVVPTPPTGSGPPDPEQQRQLDRALSDLEGYRHSLKWWDSGGADVARRARSYLNINYETMSLQTIQSMVEAKIAYFVNKNRNLVQQTIALIERLANSMNIINPLHKSSPSLLDRATLGWSALHRMINLKSGQIERDLKHKKIYDDLSGNLQYDAVIRPQQNIYQFGDIISQADPSEIGQEIAWSVRTL